MGVPEAAALASGLRVEVGTRRRWGGKPQRGFRRAVAAALGPPGAAQGVWTWGGKAVPPALGESLKPTLLPCGPRRPQVPGPFSAPLLSPLLVSCFVSGLLSNQMLCFHMDSDNFGRRIICNLFCNLWDSVNTRVNGLEAKAWLPFYLPGLFR